VASSLPLPELVRLAQHAPPAVKDAAQRLRATSELFVNVVFPGEPQVPYDWIYVYDESILFLRATYMSAIAPSNSPAGMTALQLEVPFSPSRPLPDAPEAIQERVIEQARTLGLIPQGAHVQADWMTLPYAYVIYDHARAAAVETVKTDFESRGIHPFGRYGSWAYLWSDQAVLSGKHLATQWGGRSNGSFS
jgi:protoporphyrinogen oxidase